MRIRTGLFIALVSALLFSSACKKSEEPAKSAGHDLFEAASLGDIAQVKGALQHGTPINLKDPSGQTALHYAVQSKNVELVKYLVKEGADINAKARGDVTPLLMSLDRALGDPPISLALLELGADVNIPDANKDTPLIKATVDSTDEVVEALLAKGAKVNAKGMNGVTALHQAAMNAMYERTKLLLRHGADPSIRDDQGVTPLDLVDARAAGDTGSRAKFAKTRALLAGANRAK